MTQRIPVQTAAEARAELFSALRSLERVRSACLLSDVRLPLAQVSELAAITDRLLELAHRIDPGP